ncbi:MAG: FhlB domain-containing protein [Firmicutes bacterium]|nr:FhlB domain-containing protein [Bacillota bacterium]
MEKEKAGLKQAVALRYRKDKDRAPRVVAKGKGEVAARIIEEAERHGVPLYEDPELASLLVKLPLESEIPPELYHAVAEVLVFIYQLDRKSRLSKPGREEAEGAFS